MMDKEKSGRNIVGSRSNENDSVQSLQEIFNMCTTNIKLKGVLFKFSLLAQIKRS